MSVEDGRKPPRAPLERIANPTTALDHLINSGIDHAEGVPDKPVMKWDAIVDKAGAMGGVLNRANNTFMFPSGAQREEFEKWYYDNSPPGITVRTGVLRSRTKVADLLQPTILNLSDAQVAELIVANEAPPAGSGTVAEHVARMRKLMAAMPNGPVLVTGMQPRTVVTAPQVRTLKELRMWHWREALHHRKLEGLSIERGHALMQQYHYETANLHISAVQVLNDSLPDSTAEYDCWMADHP